MTVGRPAFFIPVSESYKLFNGVISFSDEALSTDNIETIATDCNGESFACTKIGLVRGEVLFDDKIVRHPGQKKAAAFQRGEFARQDR